MTTTVMWFRRDLRLADNPALLQALKSADQVVPLFVLDDVLRKPAGGPRLAFLYDNLRCLDDAVGGNLVVRHGKPELVVSQVAREVEATQVFCTEDFGPYGRQRDDDVEAALAKHEITLERVDTPYAVGPGDIVKGDGTPFKVFTPYLRAWQSHGWGKPQARPKNPHWASVKGVGVPDDPKVDADMPKAGEDTAAKFLSTFVQRKASKYSTDRDRPSVAGTSRLSAFLKYGVIHPRQVLAKTGNSKGEAVFKSEICWRDFYADVLFHNPESARNSLQPQMKNMKLDSGKKADSRFEAWCNGMTGFPMVDAGMRQLLGEAYVHNRLRMIVASFLVKDLHVDWVRGARHFLGHLVDGDLASNNHGWQWVAGTGTDPAPYFRIFNPITQGKKFDPDGEYIRRWVPELRDLDSKFVHEPWRLTDGLPNGYPERIVDHDAERKEALARYQATRS